jgi:polysaccharide deacetylase 2 family uncharacterized protein YibQ
VIWRTRAILQNIRWLPFPNRVNACSLPWLKLLVFGLIAAALAGGCKRPAPRLRAAELHAITHELAAAASAAAGTGVEVHSELSASDRDPASSDHLDIKLRVDPEDASGRTGVTRLLQALGRVATRHGLTQDAQSESREGILFNYSRAGNATHTIHIHFDAAGASQESPPASPAAPGEHARLAIILDDLGNDRATAEAIFALPYPLTISVLPNRPHSTDIAEEAHRRGYQVMLHLPMESVGNGRPESQELRPGMSARDVSALVNQFLREVPDVAGVNNHQGSQSTTDSELMDELMPVLRDHRLFYIDSRTTAATVAYDCARHDGVRAAFRNVPFLDDVAEVSAVRKQLQRALRGAREKGEAVAIGHPHSATLAALSEVLPQTKAQGVRLVFASDLVH